MKFKVLLLPLGLATLLSAAESRSAVPETGDAHAPRKNPHSTNPRYNEDGELLVPLGFENWMFVGANLGLAYQADPPAAGPAEQSFHNIYLTRDAFEQYRRTGTFPDKTLLVLEFLSTRQGDPHGLVAQGLFPGERQQIAVAVKNRARPDGSPTNWAYYVFPRGATAAKAFDDSACYQCHVEHAAVDNVFVQFYPVLRELHQP